MEVIKIGIKISDYFSEAKYMSTRVCDELQLWGKDLMISGVREVDMKGDRKLVVDFYRLDGKEVPSLPLNKTRAKTLAKAFGDDVDNWNNKRIQLSRARVQYKSEVVGTIEVIPIKEVV